MLQEWLYSNVSPPFFSTVPHSLPPFPTLSFPNVTLSIKSSPPVIDDSLHTSALLGLDVLEDIVLVTPSKQDEVLLLHPAHQLRVLQDRGGVGHYTLHVEKQGE